MDACFWLFEPRKFKLSVKSKSEIDATVGLYLPVSVPRAYYVLTYALYQDWQTTKIEIFMKEKMKRKHAVLHQVSLMRSVMLLLFAVLTLFTSCKDEVIGQGEFKSGLLDEQQLYGQWSLDLDGNHELNLARVGYTFSQSEVNRNIEAIDLYHLEQNKLNDDGKAWSIVRNYDGFRKNGYTGDMLYMEIGGAVHRWLIKSVSKDSINFLAFFEDCAVPLTLYRAGSDCDYAPPIDESKENIEAIAGRVESLYPSEEENAEEDYSNWMSKLRDDLPVWQIAMPGTHDSSTFGIARYARFAATTQDKDFEEQWKIGVRCFDFRVRNKGNEAKMFHGFIPCEQTFKSAAKRVMMLAAKSKETTFIAINTEDNDMADGGHLKRLVTYCTIGLVEFDTTPLDEESTRKYIYNDLIALEKEVKSELGISSNEPLIIGYNPNLTLKEARGKVIVINRMPEEQGIEANYPFLGCEVIGSFSGVKDIVEKVRKPDGTEELVTHKDAIDISDLYHPEDFETHDAFLQRKWDEEVVYARKGYMRRTTHSGPMLYYNSSSASFEDRLLVYSETWGANTHIPNYPEVAERLYSNVADMFSKNRVCGIIPMDFAGTNKYNRISTSKLLAVAVPLIGEVLAPDPLARMAVFAAIEAVQACCKFDVNGGKLAQQVVKLSELNIPVDSVRIYPRIISDATVGVQYPISINIYPADATERTIKSLSSSNNAVAEAKLNGEKGELSVKKYGNARLTVQTQKGHRHSIYVVAPKGKMQAVDLGLSVLWADRNIGAAMPECDGYYYTWGDIDESLHNYVPGEYKFGSSWESYYKYSANDNIRTLQNGDDPVYVSLGNGWRMPTKAEVEELLSKKNGAEWEKYERNGVKGYVVSRNGNSIFLPAYGYMMGYDLYQDQPGEGYFWTRDIFKTAAWKWEQANCLYIRNSEDPFYGVMNNQRYHGITIRPVKDR